MTFCFNYPKINSISWKGFFLSFFFIYITDFGVSLELSWVRFEAVILIQVRWGILMMNQSVGRLAICFCQCCYLCHRFAECPFFKSSLSCLSQFCIIFIPITKLSLTHCPDVSFSNFFSYLLQYTCASSSRVPGAELT